MSRLLFEASTELRSEPVMKRITWTDDTALSVRPIEVADGERLERMFGRLSRQSVYFRFFSPIAQLAPAMLQRLTDVDHCRRDALVALDGDEIVAVARYDVLAGSERSGTRSAEVALTVEDAWQRRGVGRQLAMGLAVLARERGYEEFVARVLPENRAALGLLRNLAPDAKVKFDGDYEVRFPLSVVRARADAA